MPIQEVVNDCQWQAVRQALIGRWVKDYRLNVALLESYLEINEWDPLSVRRVLNVLTGTVHRTGKTRNQPETDQLRGQVRRKWKELLDEPYDRSDPKYSIGSI